MAGIPATEWEMGRDGEWPGLDTRSAADATGGARVLTGLRRDEGRLRPIEAPSLLGVDGSDTVRALFFHRRGDTNPAIRLSVSGTRLFADGVEQKTFDGANVILDADGAVVMDQGQNRTLIVDGGAESPAYLFDETLTAPNRVVPLVIPDTTGDMSVSVSDLSDNEIMALTNATKESSIDAVTDFHVVDALTLDSNGWSTDGFGVPTPRINTKADTPVGNGWYYVKPSGTFDWSTFNTIYFDVVADYTGIAVGFCFGTGDIDTTKPAWGGTSLPYSVEKEHELQTIGVSLLSVPVADREAVKWFGFIILREGVSDSSQFVCNWKSLRARGGTTGPREYLRTRHIVAGDLDLQSIEGPVDDQGNATVIADAGNKGAAVTLSFLDGAVPVGRVDKIWRRDTGDIQAAMFHYVGDADAGATAFTDSVTDVSQNVTLKRGRAAPLTGPACGAFSRSRLLLYKSGRLQVSAVGQVSVFNDAGPEDVTQSVALGVMGPEDGLTLNIGEIGNVRAMAKFGLDLADQYTSSLLLMTADGTDALFQGDTPDTMNIHRRQPGGIRGAHAWCHDHQGNVVSVDPNGDVMVRDRNLNSRILSGPVQEDLRNAEAGDWLMARDGLYGRLVLFADKPYVWDGGGWLNLDAATVGTVTATAMMPSPDGGRAVFGGGGGLVFRLFDPASPKAGGLFETSEWNRLPEEWRAERVWGDVEGTVTADLVADGSVVATCAFGARETAVRRHKARRFVLRLNVGADGVVHRVRTRLTPWRR